MSVHLIGVTAIGGLPLFARHCGLSATADSGRPTAENDMCFSRMAALNGVNLFSRLNDSNLLFASTKDSRIQWKVFKGSLVLIVIIDTIPDIRQNHLSVFLDLVFDSLVLICGLNEIMSQNTERLKRCLRLSYQLIDYLLNCFISKSLVKIPFISNAIEFSINGQNYHQLMQSLVETSGQLSSTSFCWLYINRKLVSGSHGFWSRLNTSKDALLITNLVLSMTDTDLMQTKEIAVYLPDNCPTSLSRLIVSQLSKGVILCLLCAEQPTIDFIDTEIIVPLIDCKRNGEMFGKYLRNEIQTSFTMDCNIIAFIFFRKDLKIFTIFGQIEDKINVLFQLLIDLQNSDKYESYLVNESTKCYNICNELSQIYVLFRFNTSLNQMRWITNKTLNSLLKDKHIWPQI